MSTASNLSDPARLSARAALAAIRAGRLSPAALVEACLDRIANRDAVVKAWAFLDPAVPRAAAGCVDPSAGPLAGLPVGVKDILETSDMPTACGSPIYEGRHTGRDAACVAALRSAGGLVMGKTATTEFAAFTPTDTRNPHAPGHTPGGSSSGSAAAVADFQVPLAIGTQTAGSIVRPAAFCGVVGFKPSFGTIDTSGMHHFASSLDTLGVFARSVGDAGLFAAAMSGWKALADPQPAPPTRVRLIPAPAWDRATPEALAALTSAAERVAEAGVPVDDSPLPDELADEITALLVAQERIQLCEGRRALAWERMAHLDRLSPGLRDHFESVADIPFEGLLEDRRLLVEGRRRIAALMAEGEVWLTLPAPGEAPEGMTTGDPVFCRAWTALHLPAIALPHGTGPAGLPLGVQLVGRPGGDPALLATAAWLETRLEPAGAPGA
ncbi:amidase [Alkalilacustris brevis]|uniref:amidase n=1 Tax=Alkalilacustris brevis TaxID=2026338 RepID=UPI000E0DBFF5|nr:amidase [Alkalilacustris brevis]